MVFDAVSLISCGSTRRTSDCIAVPVGRFSSEPEAASSASDRSFPMSSIDKGRESIASTADGGGLAAWWFSTVSGSMSSSVSSADIESDDIASDSIKPRMPRLMDGRREDGRSFADGRRDAAGDMEGKAGVGGPNWP